MYLLSRLIYIDTIPSEFSHHSIPRFVYKFLESLLPIFATRAKVLGVIFLRQRIFLREVYVKREVCPLYIPSGAPGLHQNALAQQHIGKIVLNGQSMGRGAHRDT